MRSTPIRIASCICLFAFPLASLADDYSIQWIHSIDNGHWDGAFSVAVDHSNNIIVTGSSFIGGNNDFFTVKYDPHATILWDDTIDHGQDDFAEAVAVDHANHIIVTGYSHIHGDYDYLTLKYDSDGQVAWTDTIDNHGRYDIARSVAIDDANNIILTGYCDIDGDCVYFTAKYHSNATIIWQDTLAHGHFDSAFGVAVDNANNIIVTGYTSTALNNDYLTVKYDSAGTILWQDTVDHRQYDQAYGVAVDNSNNIIVTGCSAEALSDYDYFTVKYDSAGTVLWQDTFDNDGHDDVAYSVAVDNADNIIVTGSSVEPLGNYDYFTLKYDSNGAVLWKGTLDNGSDDIAHCVAVDDSNNIIVTGKSYIDDSFDYLTVKYAPIPANCEDSDPDLVGADALFCEIYPNPCRDQTCIRVQMVKGNLEVNGQDQIAIDICSPAGRLLRSLPISELGERGSAVSQVMWQGDDNSGQRLRSGVYFVRFKAGGVGGTEKVVLLR